jgi:hypothetical protein
MPRLDLPTFDAAKAAKLTPEKRAAYEQELFSELQQWNRGSRKYPTLADIGRREQRWQAMADDGFELAHITLSVLKPEGGLVYSLSGPMRRLEELAKQGDAGAMCLMPGLVGRASLKQSIEDYRNTYRVWLERGAQLAHPECQTHLGRRLIVGTDGFVKDTKRGLDLEFMARHSGYAHDVGALIQYFQAKGYGDTANVRRLYCWRQIDARSWITDAPERLLEDLKREALHSRKAELLALHEELLSTQNTLQDCVELGLGA